MKTGKACIVLACLLVGLAPEASAQMSAIDVRTANVQSAEATREIAALALAESTPRGDPTKVNPLGLPVDAPTAPSLGTAIPVYFVPLDKLRQYKEGTDPLSLLSPPSQVVYQVQQGTAKVPAIVEVSKKADSSAWALSGLGRSTLARDLNSLPATGRGPGAAAVMSLWIPALNIRFVGQLNATSLMLTPLADNPKLGFKKGQAISAAAAFVILQREAMKIDPNVPR